MPSHEGHILGILGEAIEPMFPSEIKELLNHELRPGAAHTTTEVATRPLACWLLWHTAPDKSSLIIQDEFGNNALPVST
jgi:hypothetical protein